MLVDLSVPGRMVMQPENETERRALQSLASLLPRAFFTLDVPEYPALDADLWRAARFNPARDVIEAGARALVVALSHDGDGGDRADDPPPVGVPATTDDSMPEDWGGPAGNTPEGVV